MGVEIMRNAPHKLVMKPINPAYFNALICLALLSGCSTATVDDTPVTVAPPPRPAVVAPPAPAPEPVRNIDEWRDWPALQGNWTYSQDTIGSIARFIAPNGVVQAMLRCEEANATVFVSLAGTSNACASMELRTTSGRNSFATRPAPGGETFVYATIPARDSMLDNIAYSRGKFLIAVDGVNALSLPAWPETGRVIEDCR